MSDKKKKKKYYVVWDGKRPGIYGDWEQCQAQVVGFPGARFKSFKTLPLAAAAFEHSPTPLPCGEGLCLTVDGACSGYNGEYRGVLLPSRNQVFHFGPWDFATNNIVEFLAIVRGLQWMHTRGLKIPLYSDSRTAIAWVKQGGQCRSARPPPCDCPIYQEVAKSEAWLNGCPEAPEYVVLLQKWDTEKFGEVPADFGRK
jgi:ribonuclease HI